MDKTPTSMRKYIGIFGNTNAGKSTLFNALTGQNITIVSDISGTTTDPVLKPMELIGYGAVTLVDTAGFNDLSRLGALRYNKTKEVLNRCDLAIWTQDITDEEKQDIEFGTTPVVKVYTKCDKIDKGMLDERKQKEPQCIYIAEYNETEIKTLRYAIITELLKQSRDDETILGNILTQGDTVILVIPIDSAAPKGRLILPQVQVLRDCLDNNITAVCVSLHMLGNVLNETKKIDLVICDSQIFNQVSQIVPEEINLTSFSMLLANRSGRIRQLIEGTKAIDGLKDNDKILMLEACTHSTTHEDIGKVKIPTLLKKITGKELQFYYCSGYDFPENLSDFSLIIQCGGCMINKRTIANRLIEFEQNNIPVTNYGVILAYLNGILERSSKIFK